MVRSQTSVSCLVVEGFHRLLKGLDRGSNIRNNTMLGRWECCGVVREAGG